MGAVDVVSLAAVVFVVSVSSLLVQETITIDANMVRYVEGFGKKKFDFILIDLKYDNNKLFAKTLPIIAMADRAASLMRRNNSLCQRVGSNEITTDLWTLGGKPDKNILGKAVIVHGGVDDYKTQPTGNAGTRIGCAVIQ